MARRTRDSWSGVVSTGGAGRHVTVIAGDAGGGRPLHAATRFQASSISKALVAVTALRLAEQGGLDLVSPVATWLPDLPADKAALTMHQLLSHSSGLGHWPDLPDVDMADPPERAALVDAFLARPVPHPVGSFRYSNFGYLLAAAVIERVTGGPYAEAVTESVLHPAGMMRSTSGVFPDAADDHALGHADGSLVALSPRPTGLPGGGDLWTTAGDLLLFEQALFSGRLLRPESVAAMTSRQVRFEAPVALGDERVRADGYGYGGWIGSVAGTPAVIHPGDNVGYRSLLVHLSDAGRDIAILTNDEAPTLAAPLDIVLASPIVGESRCR